MNDEERHREGMRVRRRALRNGLTPEGIGEVILRTALYAGLPAANAAFAIAQSVIDGEEAS